MTQSQYIIARKLSIVELGETLGNISDACRNMGVSRQHYYDVKQAIEEEGLEGLLEKSRRAPRKANRVPDEVEQALLDYSLQYPPHGQVRTANELKKAGYVMSPGGVRSVWMRHNLQTKVLRLKRLEAFSAEEGVILTESQVQASRSGQTGEGGAWRGRESSSRLSCWAGYLLRWDDQGSGPYLSADRYRHPR